jgi:hypothetical protein
LKHYLCTVFNHNYTVDGCQSWFRPGCTEAVRLAAAKVAVRNGREAAAKAYVRTVGRVRGRFLRELNAPTGDYPDGNPLADVGSDSAPRPPLVPAGHLFLRRCRYKGRTPRARAERDRLITELQRACQLQVSSPDEQRMLNDYEGDALDAAIAAIASASASVEGFVGAPPGILATPEGWIYSIRRDKGRQDKGPS